jgi:hypothetical protein
VKNGVVEVSWAAPIDDGGAPFDPANGVNVAYMVYVNGNLYREEYEPSDPCWVKTTCRIPVDSELLNPGYNYIDVSPVNNAGGGNFDWTSVDVVRVPNLEGLEGIFMADADNSRGVLTVSWMGRTGSLLHNREVRQGAHLEQLEVRAVPRNFKGTATALNKASISCPLVTPYASECSIPVRSNIPYDLKVRAKNKAGWSEAITVVEGGELGFVSLPDAMQFVSSNLQGLSGEFYESVDDGQGYITLLGNGFAPGSVIQLFSYPTGYSFGEVLASDEGSFYFDGTFEAALRIDTDVLAAIGVDSKGAARVQTHVLQDTTAPNIVNVKTSNSDLRPGAKFTVTVETHDASPLEYVDLRFEAFGSWTDNGDGTNTHTPAGAPNYMCQNNQRTTQSSLTGIETRIFSCQVPSVIQNGQHLIFVEAYDANGYGVDYHSSVYGTTQITGGSDASPPTLMSDPTVSGRDSGMYAKPGLWQGFPTPTLSYQWFRCNNAVVAAADTPDSECTSISGATTSYRNVSDEDVGKHLVVGITATNSSGSTVRFTGSIYVVSTTCDAFAQEICPNSVQYDYGWSFDDQTAQANHIVSVVNQEAELSVFITMAEPYENPFPVKNYSQTLSCSGDSAPESEEENFSLIIEANARNGIVSYRILINGHSVEVNETEIKSGGSRRVTLTFAIPQDTPNLILTCQSSVGGWDDDPQQGFGDGYMFPLRINGQ